VDDLILGIGCTFLGGAGAWLISRWGKKFSLLDHPNDRSSHDTVVPKGGGIGILAAFLFCSIVLDAPKNFWIPTGFLAIFSFWGDRSEISPKIRLVIQFIAAAVVVLGGVLWGKQSSMVTYLLIIPVAFFVVATANYYNFMDGINGIAGVTGVVGFGLIALFGVLSGANESFLILAGCMGFACLGFLRFNMPKARVFMGDVGIHRLRGFHGSKNMYEGLVTVVEIEGHSEFCSKVAYTLTEWAWARVDFAVR
jgi:Fuc2NAc and GlcNAc transferase